MHWTTYDSPLGTLTLTEEDGRITGIRFPGRHGDLRPADRSDAPFAALRAQLDEYFDGARRTFDVEVEQPLLALQPAAVAGERAVGADHAVAGHDDRDGRAPDGGADRAHAVHAAER